MKVNCLIQATLGSLLIQDFALQQDTARIFRAGIRVTRCLVELLSQKNNYKCLLSALLLCKSFKARLWEDSKYVSKQLDGIGPTLSTALVNARLTSFEKIEETNPREIELIVNRHPPFGNQVKDNISKLPKYELVIEQVMRYSESAAEIVITLQITNRDTMKESSTGHTCTLLVGDEDNKVLYKQRVMDALLLKEKSWSKKLEVRRAEKGPELSLHYISQDWVGLDVECTYTPNYLGGKRITSSSTGNQQAKSAVTAGSCATTNLPCMHTCHNKMTCAHECCKHGISSKRRGTSNQQTPRPVSTKRVASHLEELKNRAASLPTTPSVNKRMKLQGNGNASRTDLTQFSYAPNRNNQDFVYQAAAMPDKEFGLYVEPSNDLSRHVGQESRTFKPRQQNIPRHKNDWEELDMYAEHRQTCNQDDIILIDEESLPDLEAMHEEFAGINPNWASVPNGEDDFAHETEYGYAYVTGGDRPEPPLEWDDRINEQWHKDSRNHCDDAVHHDVRQGNTYSVRRQFQGGNDKLGCNRSAKRPSFRKQPVHCTILAN
ncbi:probable ATP-dependent DNA helicase HFM1 [Mercenaria mercenaria]|uniref:probable ATP-dependent DNA helicase HFM1 n=1 Tax=Mercenaria mercenaria TaxID=6596 RepID=UPI00234E81E5|nr:probable ATP-dependent DNA helicase HFM1 [Mercenaria mercenaria]